MRFNIFALINEVWNFVGSFLFANIILLIFIWTDRFAYWLIGRRLWRKFGGLMLFIFIFWQLAVGKGSFYEIEFVKIFILNPERIPMVTKSWKPKTFSYIFLKVFKIFVENFKSLWGLLARKRQHCGISRKRFLRFFTQDFLGISKSQSRSPGFRDF